MNVYVYLLLIVNLVRITTLSSKLYVKINLGEFKAEKVLCIYLNWTNKFLEEHRLSV